MPKKKTKIILVAILMSSLAMMYGAMPAVKAASLQDASDTISDSDISATNVRHTIEFTTGVGLIATDIMEVTFPASTTNILVGNVACPTDSDADVVGQVVTCTATDVIGAGAMTIVVGTTTNPDVAGSYTVSIKTKSSGGTVIEETDVMFYIIDDVTVTAHVDPILTFSIAGLNPGVDVNGVVTTATTTATTTPFGNLQPNASTTVGQQLTVSTNADDGFVVTVQQDQELTSAGGSTINSFDNSPDDTGSTSPHAWTAPANTIDQPHTYGHMGLTSEDASLSGGDTFGTALYVGLNGAAPVEVMYHGGPSAGTGDSIGVTQVAYTAEIGAMQEAGDYQNTLTYICTPTY